MNTIKKTQKEAQELIVTGLKLTTIVAPLVGAITVGLPELTRNEITALALLVAGLGMGVYWLNNPRRK